MGLTDKFLVNTKNFEAIVEKLRTTPELPEELDHTYLEDLGYTNPSDLLILNILKELKMLSPNDAPTPVFEKFRVNETSKEAFAYGIVEAYGDLLENNPDICRASVEELTEKFRDLLGSKKSDLILKYMANTFKTLVNYAGPKNVELVLKTRVPEEESGVESIIKEIAERHKNGREELPRSKDEISVVEASEGEEAEGTIKKEEKGETEINEFMHPVSTEEQELDQELSSEDTSDDNSDSVEFMDESETEATNEEEEAELEDVHTDNPFFEDSGKNKNDESENEGSDNMELTKTTNKEERTISGGSTTYINKALLKKAELLFKLGKHQQALPAFDDIYNRFKDSNSAELHNHASEALISKMEISEKLELDDKLIPLYNKVIDRLADSEYANFVNHVDHAFIKKTEMLVDSNNLKESLEAIDAAIYRFKNANRESSFLQKAMYLKGEILEKLGKDTEALEAYEEFLSTFNQD